MVLTDNTKSILTRRLTYLKGLYDANLHNSYDCSEISALTDVISGKDTVRRRSKKMLARRYEYLMLELCKGLANSHDRAELKALDEVMRYIDE